MELRLKQITFPEAIEFNFSELKKEITERMAEYTGLVYAEEQIKDAKKDVAMLRKFAKALSDERIRVKKDLMKPYEEFEKKIKELTGLVDNVVGEIDSQIKSFEDKQKQDKLDNITSFFNTTEHPEWLHMSQIFNEKWLNASTSMKSVQDEINSKLEQIQNDLATLQNLPEFGFEAAEVYKTTLDINKALNEGKRLSEIAKAKAAHEAEMKARAEEQARLAEEAEAKKAEQIEGQVEFTDTKSFDENVLKPTQEAPAKMWVKFQAFMTVEQAKELKQFFDDRKIEFKAV